MMSLIEWDTKLVWKARLLMGQFGFSRSKVSIKSVKILNQCAQRLSAASLSES